MEVPLFKPKTVMSKLWLVVPLVKLDAMFDSKISNNTRKYQKNSTGKKRKHLEDQVPYLTKPVLSAGTHNEPTGGWWRPKNPLGHSRF